MSEIKLTPQLKHLAGMNIYPETTTGWNKCVVCESLAFARWFGQCADCYHDALRVMQAENYTTSQLISDLDLWPFKIENPEQAAERLEDMDDITDAFLSFQLSMMLRITEEMSY